MARARSVDKYPIAAYITLFTAARQVSDNGKTYRLLCETHKAAITRRFEFYSFLRALNKSPELAHTVMAKEFRGFKLTLLSSGEGDKTYIQFEAWDSTALALDILAQVKAFQEANGLPEQVPPGPAKLEPGQVPLGQEEDESGKAQMDAFTRLGYGGKPK